MTRLLTLALILSVLWAVTPAVAGEWFGVSPNKADEAVGVATVMAAPEDWEGRELLIGGRITDVCTNRGCWAVFEDNGEILRIMVRDHAFGLPAEARGPAVAHGKLEKVEISAGHARHLVEDDGADAEILDQDYEYRLMTTGVRILPET